VDDPIVGFFAGGTDDHGRTLADILSWDDGRLEAVHDYIQWLFPTRQPSAVNQSAPLVSDGTAAAFVDAVVLRDRLRDALDRMLVFYGLRRSGERIAIDPARFPARSRVWLQPGNHNHLRLTRIMQSLASLGLHDEAIALQRCLLEEVVPAHPEGVSGTTAGFWKAAVGRR
jgi:hypothetical protein